MAFKIKPRHSVWVVFLCGEYVRCSCMEKGSFTELLRRLVKDGYVFGVSPEFHDDIGAIADVAPFEQALPWYSKLPKMEKLTGVIILCGEEGVTTPTEREVLDQIAKYEARIFIVGDNDYCIINGYTCERHNGRDELRSWGSWCHQHAHTPLYKAIAHPRMRAAWTM